MRATSRNRLAGKIKKTFPLSVTVLSPEYVVTRSKGLYNRVDHLCRRSEISMGQWTCSLFEHGISIFFRNKFTALSDNPSAM